MTFYKVKIGNVWLGSEYPVRIQSMTNTDTADIAATVEQCIKIIERGGEMVRMTVQGKKELHALPEIKKQLRDKGFDTPLIADIHFNPEMAEGSAKIIEKIRINPGNYTDKRAKFEQMQLSDAEYKQELKRIRHRVKPLFDICKQYDTAIRIGTNHGSLSDRIMSRYGNTPEGMVQATVEFLRIAASEGFHNMVISLKSSNTRVMVAAYRLMARQMIQEKKWYPLHLGVTEAGDGDEGRIKSALGIGTLLRDGIGDTIRVSLTEPPENEIPFAKKIVKHFADIRHQHFTGNSDKKNIDTNYQKRKTATRGLIGGNNPVVVVADLSDLNTTLNPLMKKLGVHYDMINKTWIKSPSAPDFVYTKELPDEFLNPSSVGIITEYETWRKTKKTENTIFPVFSMHDYLNCHEKSEQLNFVKMKAGDLTLENIKRLKPWNRLVFIAEIDSCDQIDDIKCRFKTYEKNSIDVPVILKQNTHFTDFDDMIISASAGAGSLFLDGLGDGIWLQNSLPDTPHYFDLERMNALAFGILQAARIRISRTEYISCPTCGRTQYDMAKVMAEIKQKTAHLSGLKIAVMGCVVNGPGEMADADYGYIGSARGKAGLYKQRHLKKRNVPASKAVDELINLIKENGD